MRKIKKYIKDVDKSIAFVLGAGETALGVIRSLGKHHIPIIALDPSLGAIGLFSKYCKGIVCPDPKEKEEEYISFLLGVAEQMNSKGVLIPTSDEHVLAISRHRNVLESCYHLTAAKPDVIEKIVNKRRYYEIVEKLRMLYPKTYFPDDVSTVKGVSKDITYPCIIKPIFSTEFGKQFGVKIFKANSAEELIKAYSKAISGGYEAVIQEVIPGDDANIYGFCSYANREFEPVGIFIYKKIRGYPEGFGVCSLVESTFEPEIIVLGTQILKIFNYHGISEIEFKKDTRDGKFKIIEMNARTWAENSLAVRCGVDLSYMAYMDAIGKEVEGAISEKVGVKWLNVFIDIRSFLETMSRGELSLIKWVNFLRGEREYAVFDWSDPLPFLAYPFYLMPAALRRLFYEIKSAVRQS